MQSIITAEAKRLDSIQAAIWHIADNSAAPEYGEKFFEDYALFGELFQEIEKIRAAQRVCANCGRWNSETLFCSEFNLPICSGAITDCHLFVPMKKEVAQM